MMTDQELLQLAATARQTAYAPYSQFTVGAALLCDDGTVYTGCNVESASYTPTVCAERVAFFKAVSDGKRAFTAMAVTGGKNGDAPAFCPPCGVCRQVMAEFCDGSFTVISGNPNGEIHRYTLDELLPNRFSL